MSPASGTPSLCIVGGDAFANPVSIVHKLLHEAAQSRDWPVRVLAAACDDEMDESAALVLLVGGVSVVSRLRR